MDTKQASMSAEEPNTFHEMCRKALSHGGKTMDMKYCRSGCCSDHVRKKDEFLSPSFPSETLLLLFPPTALSGLLSRRNTDDAAWFCCCCCGCCRLITRLENDIALAYSAMAIIMIIPVALLRVAVYSSCG